MVTKKSAAKKTVAEDQATPAKAAAKKTVAKKTAAKKTAAGQHPSETQTAAAEQPKAAAHKAKPTHHDIELHAYLLWERDGKPHGNHVDYWHRAEKELHG